MTAHDEVSGGEYRPRMDVGGQARSLWMATRPHAGHHGMAPHGVIAEAQDKRDRRRVVSPHAGHDERPGK